MAQSDPHQLALLQWIENSKLAEKEPLLLLVLVLVGLVIVLALMSIARARRNPGVSPGRFQSELQGVQLLLNDFTGRFSTTQTKLTEDVSALKERMGRLERELQVMSQRSAEQFERDLERRAKPSPESAEKKTEFLAPTFPPTSPILTSPSVELSRATGEAVTKGLSKTRNSFLNRLKSLFVGGSVVDDAFFQTLEEQLIQSDLGVKTSAEIISFLRDQAKHGRELTEDSLRVVLAEHLEKLLTDSRPVDLELRSSGPTVLVMVGVNGVGKTTTIGKLAKDFSSAGKKVILGACDTFRAAASEQLQSWGARAGCEVVAGAEGSKPATVAYQTIHRGIEVDADVIIIDTAGRLHTRQNLMSELGAVLKLIERELPGAPHEIFLVLDASTGQNALSQAREFHNVCSLSGIVVTKLDGTPKGGIVVAIRNELKIPIRYIGVGEGAEDLRAFSAKQFAASLVDGGDEEVSVKESYTGQVRRRRREELVAS